MRKKTTAHRTALSDELGIEHKTRKTKRKSEEKKISYSVADFLVIKYPTVIYRFDVGADLKLTMGQAMQVKDKLKHKRGYHDLTILEARGGYFGLFIELKKSRSEVFRQDGELSKKRRKDGTDHNVEQYLHLEKLRKKGYYAVYAFGLEHAIELITNYMEKESTNFVIDQDFHIFEL